MRPDYSLYSRCRQANPLALILVPNGAGLQAFDEDAYEVCRLTGAMFVVVGGRHLAEIQEADIPRLEAAGHQVIVVPKGGHDGLQEDE